MMFQIQAYLKFLWRSTNAHGVHSPFLYRLLTECLYDRTSYPEYEQLKSYRDELLHDATVIEVTDMGAGSRRFKANTRKVSQMARTAGSSLKRMQWLFRWVRYSQPKSILELGTSLGLGTYAMAMGHASASIITVEGCPNLSNHTALRLTAVNQLQVDLRSATFQSALESLSGSTFDLIVLDGHHDGDATLTYMESLFDMVHEDSVIIIDDIHWSKDMAIAWKQLKADSRVRQSMDTFYCGWLFFKTAQAREHFHIRL